MAFNCLKILKVKCFQRFGFRWVNLHLYSAGAVTGTLDLGSMGVGPAGAVILGRLLSPVQDASSKEWRFPCPVKEINLWANDIGDEGVVAIGEAVQPRQNPESAGGAWVFNDHLVRVRVGAWVPILPVLGRVAVQA